MTKTKEAEPAVTMAVPAFKLKEKDLGEYADMSIDELLEKLNDEEIEELGIDLIDPDDSCIPPSQRCKYRCEKEATGKFDRKGLLDYLEKKAKEEKDWEETKPYAKETRGKVWKPKDVENTQVLGDDEAHLETEWDEVLKQATEEELVDLAAILGFHGMLNQVQYHDAFVEQKEKKEGETGGFKGVAAHQDFKLYQDEPPNQTDVEDVLNKLRDNDPTLKEINLNNIKNISLERLTEIAEALADNTHLEELQMANTKTTYKVAKKIGESLQKNETLKVLNLESNYISGEGIVAVLEGVNENQALVELRVANQRPSLLGHKVESRIVELLKDITCLKKFGIFLELPGPRVKLIEYVKRNNDLARKERVGDAKD